MKPKPIDRERPEILKLRDSLKKLFQKAFAADAASAAAHQAKGLGLEKVISDQLSVISKGKKTPLITDHCSLITEPERLRKAQDDENAKIDKLLAELELAGIEATREEAAAILARAAQNDGWAALVQLDYEAPPGITNLVNRQAVAWASRHAADLVTKIGEDTRDMTRATVVQAQQQVWSAKKLADALQESHGFNDARAMRIARTELIRSDCQGNLIAYKESGLVQSKDWILGSEHPEQDECYDNAAQGEIPLEQAFAGGDGAPPAHPHCTCDFVPRGIEGVEA